MAINCVHILWRIVWRARTWTHTWHSACAQNGKQKRNRIVNTQCYRTHIPCSQYTIRLNLNGMMETAAAAARQSAHKEINPLKKRNEWPGLGSYCGLCGAVCLRVDIYSEFAIIHSLNTRAMSTGSIIFILFCVRACARAATTAVRGRDNETQSRSKLVRASHIVNDGVGWILPVSMYGNVIHRWLNSDSLAITHDYPASEPSVNLILIQFHKSIKSISSFGIHSICSTGLSLLLAGIAVSSASLWNTHTP